jgi:membrane protein
VKIIPKLLKRTLQEFIDDDCPALAAALAYYTVFSLPPLILIVIKSVGSILGRAAVEGKIEQQIVGLVGPRAAEQVQTMIAEASIDGSRWLTWTMGIAALVFAATSAFAQLQSSLNRAWEVKPDPHAGGLRKFLLKRVLSFGMILAVGFLLLVSLAISAALSAFGDALAWLLPVYLSKHVLWATSSVVSLVVITALFAALYKVLPDAQIDWRDAITGAVATAILFALGKYLIGLYLGNSNALTPFGAAGSLALILLWTYYSAMIFLLGAEFTQVWAKDHGRTIVPEPGAVHVAQGEKQLG